ncbi:hypothetical protein [Caballeronia sp. Lep1P3]|uniref:hypothetical protein n=1 Tax=Caballeronia sp. Lep1P3 TaxID=2878150 RepID=UPI001FD48F9B|nr:hypothetical protein [Caballeronia sp. Lep1P3]
MNSSSFASSVAALAASLCSTLVLSATPSRAAEPLPDPHILSAAPFQFQADHGIYSRVHPTPADSRIFSPRIAPRGDEASLVSQARPKPSNVL